MPAELRAERLGDLVRLQLVETRLEFRDEHAWQLEAEITAAVFRSGVVGEFLGQLHEVFTGLEAVVDVARSEEHTSELQSLMRISYAVLCLKKKRTLINHSNNPLINLPLTTHV